MAKKKEQPKKEKLILPDRYILIAADLSLMRPGFAKFEIDKINTLDIIKSISFTSIDNKRKHNKPHGQIINEIMSTFISFIGYPEYPIYLVREKEIMLVKVPSERNVSKVIGIMDWWAYAESLCSPYKKGITSEWDEIYPSTIKKMVAGSGNADKETVAKSLEKYIGVREYACDDESDAAAVGISWLIQHDEIKEIEQ